MISLDAENMIVSPVGLVVRVSHYFFIPEHESRYGGDGGGGGDFFLSLVSSSMSDMALLYDHAQWAIFLFRIL